MRTETHGRVFRHFEDPHATSTVTAYGQQLNRQMFCTHPPKTCPFCVHTERMLLLL